MPKTYFNDAIIGNSRMLGCLTGNGELTRLFWPNIDYPQHIDKINSGVFFTDQKHSTIWLNDENLQHVQRYVKDTNIIETVCTCEDRGLRTTQTDFVLPQKDVLVRLYDIENIGRYEADLGFVVYSSGISNTHALCSSLFDFGNDALIHYRHNYYIAISGDTEAYQFQLGDNAFECAKHTELNGRNTIGMMADGAVSWKLGTVRPGEKKQFALRICAAHTLKEVKRLVRAARNSNAAVELEDTRKYWEEFLKSAKQVNTGKEEVDNLYKRSLLVFKLMSDEKSGGLLASAEIDEEFTRCGRYAYCWGRDAAFITGALDKCGLTSVVDKFYRWAVDVQDDDGSWQQRYHMDGNLAPSWGLQIDETGTLVWGMLQHYKMTGDKVFLTEMWESVRKAVSFMIGFIDIETGLPGLSYDLWEERFGEHFYSSAAVYGGIMAGVEIAGILNICDEKIGNWKKAAEEIKQAMEKHFWKDEWKRFIRSVRTKLNPWGSEHSQNTAVVKVNPKGYLRDVTLEDGTVDISLLGASIPFDVFAVDDFRIENTVDTIERVLASYGTGGIKRYENDNYIGGNPWVLATLWVALYYCKKKDFNSAGAYFDWAVKARTGLDLLPEQASKDDGKPVWVIPLTWSHAMFVLTLMELTEAGAI